MKGIGTSTYRKLLVDFDKFNFLLIELGITTKYSRLHEAASLVEKLDRKVRKSKKSKAKIGNIPEKYLHGLWILSEISHIFKAVDSFDKAVLKTKLEKIIKGKLILKDETRTNSKARNTMFELLLASDLVNNGYNASLGEPNPDIEVAFSDKKYLFECKRIFSEKKIKRQVSEAKKQLEKLLITGQNSYGVIAISIPRLYIGKGEKLIARSWEEAMQFLNKTMYVFVEKYKRHWKNISNERIVAVIFHLTCPALIDRVSTVTYYTRTNVHDDETFDVFINDFDKLPKVEHQI